MENRKSFTADEVRELAPWYKGKPENFDPNKVKQKGRKPPQSDKSANFSNSKSKTEGNSDKRPGPSSGKLMEGTHVHVAQKPTPQKNHSLLDEAIFGPEPCTVPIHPLETFTDNFSQIIKISELIYQSFAPDVKQLDRKLEKEELAYYTTVILWLRLVDIKQKQGLQALTGNEKDFLKACKDMEFNVPKPLAIYLTQIGDITDRMGKETLLGTVNLPNAVNGGLGGYLTVGISSTNHMLVGEIPTMGTAGDILMALTSAAAIAPSWRIPVPAEGGNPAGTLVPEKLPNYLGPARVVREEIRAKLLSYGITTTTFKENITNTRFNLPYVKSISDTIGSFDTFSMDKICFDRLTKSGGDTQIIKGKPTAGGNTDWRETEIHTVSAAAQGPGNCGGATVFGFQLYKDPAITANWILATWAAGAAAVMEPLYAATVNDRRAMPDGIGTERFRSIARRQDLTAFEVVQKMVKTTR